MQDHREKASCDTAQSAMLTLLIVLGSIAYTAVGMVVGYARLAWIKEHDFVMSGGDMRPFIAGLFWPLTLVIGYAKSLGEDLVNGR